MATSSRVKLRAVQAEKSRATRRRILLAGTELFVRDGYLQTTMADIAARADVAVRTVYLSFGSKVAVLIEALDVAIVGDDEPVPVMERAWFRRSMAEPDAAAALAVFVDGAGGVIDRVYPLYAATRDGSADPELADVLARNKQGRLATHTRVAHELAAKAGADPGVPVQHAAEIIYTLMSQETYGLLVVENGWSVPAWTRWVYQHLRSELLTD